LACRVLVRPVLLAIGRNCDGTGKTQILFAADIPETLGA